MAYKMTKQGSLDNQVTNEFFCDTVADMNAIENKYRTLGSIAIVLDGESGGLEIYITNSAREWTPLNISTGDSGPGTSTDLSNYLQKSDIAAWAKAENKPTYTASEVGAPTTTEMNNALAGKDESITVHLSVDIINKTVTSDLTLNQIKVAYNQGKKIYGIMSMEENGESLVYATYGMPMSMNITNLNMFGIVFQYANNILISGSQNIQTNEDQWSYVDYITLRTTTDANSYFNAENKKIIYLATPTDNNDAANKTYVDSTIVSTRPATVFYGLASAAGDSSQSVSTNAIGTYTTEAKAAILNMLNAASKVDTILNTTLSRGRKANTTIGTGSIAFGNDVMASGSYSVAVGDGTMATNYCMQAFGMFNNPYGPLFPEWVANTSYNVGDKVMRTQTEIDGETGDQREVYGFFVCTTANNDSIFNSAKWNTWDNGFYGFYAEMVGNGLDNGNRMNARTLDWNGNEYLAGDIYVNCNADSTGGVKLARIPYPPTTDGTYTLKATVSSGTITYTWVAGA